jgi:hypothetical protein
LPADTLALVELALVVLEREPQLLDRFVARGKGFRTVSAEIMIGALEISLRVLERRDCLANFRVPFTTSGSSLPRRSCRLLR